MPPTSQDSELGQWGGTKPSCYDYYTLPSQSALGMISSSLHIVVHILQRLFLASQMYGNGAQYENLLLKTQSRMKLIRKEWVGIKRGTMLSMRATAAKLNSLNPRPE